MVIFALMWLGRIFPEVGDSRERTRLLLLVPWALFGLIMVVRPNWILRATRAVDKALEDDREEIRLIAIS
jgi:hypothetical protein